MRCVLAKFTGIRISPIIECNISSVRNGIFGHLRMSVMASVDTLPNGTAIGTRAVTSGLEPFGWASILAMLTDIPLFFDKMFTGWRVLFLSSEPGTLGVRSLMPAPSPASSRIRSSAIQTGLESTLSAAFPFGRNWDP
jgi:hypothetical protein